MIGIALIKGLPNAHFLVIYLQSDFALFLLVLPTLLESTHPLIPLLGVRANKLPISRLQRDLTDSTVLRNIGVPISHNIISIRSLIKGINKLELEESAIQQDLEKNWAVVAEAIQTILRREGYPKPYEALKDLTRVNEKITKDSIWRFIDGLNLSDAIKSELKEITPYNYTGIRQG